VATTTGEVLDVAVRDTAIPEPGTPAHLVLDPAVAVTLPAPA